LIVVVGDEIAGTVYVQLRTLVPNEFIITSESRIFADLKMASDDATALILDLQRILNARVPHAAWADVVTVGDVIAVFEQYAGGRLAP